jgi:hypothetical protein
MHGIGCLPDATQISIAEGETILARLAGPVALCRVGTLKMHAG